MVAAAPPRILRDATADDAVLSTLDSFDALGIAVFPQRLREKGTWVEGWPTLPVHQALLLTRAEARRGLINLAGRTGSGVAVIDLDAKDGCEPEALLGLLRERLSSALIAVVKTSRGYHLWLRVSKSVGNGYCSAIGGQIFSEPHLAMLPPSIHPDGHGYKWVQEARPAAVSVDLAELGLVPDKPTFATNKSNKRAPESPEVQAEFAALMAEKGLSRRHRVQDLVHCPRHEDRHPSLSINWETALFHCFAEACGVQGGIGALRRLLGKDTPTYRQGKPPSVVGKWGCDEAEVERLADGLIELGLQDQARKVRGCRKVFAVGKCGGCAATPAYPLSCGQPICPRCLRGRLEADWRDHAAEIPQSLTLLRLRPRDFWGLDGQVIKKVRNRFREWRERVGLKGGLYGIRLEWGRGAVILLALPSGHPVPEATRAFEVEVVRRDCSPEDYLRWLQDEYSAEACDWETDQDLTLLLEQTRRRRRFQGFGVAYAAKEETGTEVPEAEPGSMALSKVSGGSHSSPAKKDVRLCPHCGSRIEMQSFTVSQGEVELRDGFLQWVGPGGRPAVAA